MAEDKEDKFDPELLQLRWVLEGITPETLPDQAALALGQGFDGTALRQLAGLVRPTFRELETLPDRAFTELGFNSISKEQAATSLIARGLPHVSSTIAVFLKSFPGFSERWKRHVMNWNGESAGSYNDINQFVHFVVDDLYQTGNQLEVGRFFTVLELILAQADDDTKNLIAVGFLERLRNHASRRTFGSDVFEAFMGLKSRQMWNDLQAGWAKSPVDDESDDPRPVRVEPRCS